jgi:hypothetical protein
LLVPSPVAVTLVPTVTVAMKTLEWSGPLSATEYTGTPAPTLAAAS